MSEIKIKSVKNLRDFGEIVNKDGKTLKNGFFIRSGSLSSLSEKEKDILFTDFNVKTVIDLRTQGEIREKPDQLEEGVAYYNIPIINEAMAGISHEKEARKDLSLIPDLADLYRLVASNDHSIEQIKKVFEVILDRYEDGAVLWHCSEGKDRCGMISALFLSLLDVDRETIFENYLLSNQYGRRKAKKYYTLVVLVKHNKEYAKKAYGVFIADRKYMEAAFDAIEAHSGSIEAFLKDRIGITDEQKEKLKDFYLQ